MIIRQSKQLHTFARTRINFIGRLILFPMFLVAAGNAGADAAASTHMISGVVTDEAGAPVRGALLTVKYGENARGVARYSNAAGAYSIDVPSAPVSVTASVFGYASESKALAVKDKQVNFKLKKEFDRRALSSAEVVSTLPQNEEIRWLEARCVACHGMSQLENVRGVPEQTWLAIFETMTLEYDTDLTKEQKAYAAKLATKYFGPGTKPPEAGDIKRAPLADEALRATYHTIDLPRPPNPATPVEAHVFPHSIVADNLGGAWVAEVNMNRIARWDLERGTLTPVTLKERSLPHTPTIDHKGWPWTATVGNKEIVGIDPKTLKVETIKLESQPHTLSTDSDGGIWGNGSKIFRFDPETRSVHYWQTLITPTNENSFVNRIKVPGEEKAKAFPGAYHAVRDSKGIVWYTSFFTGGLVRLDPATGQQKYFNPGNIGASRGMAVDADGNVWVTDWLGHRMAKFTPATETWKLYSFPTRFAMPYSIFIDDKRGYIWSADFSGDNLTRFDPRTEKFVEYPLPKKNSYPRFVSVDKQGRVWFTGNWNDYIGVLDPGYDD